MAGWVRHERVEETSPTQPQTTTNIDNCCFVDRQCMTDEEWISGYWALQNGQCNAPTQSQTQSSTETTSTVSSQIDNCCFVDRTCNTDQEWTDGYWAFQNGQCSAPVQTQSQASTQPASVDPGQSDNCCFLGWHCRTDLEWANGFHAYRDNKCGMATPAETADSCCQLGWNCTLEENRLVGRWTVEEGIDCGAPIQVPFDGTIIEGTETFIAQATAALDLLRSKAPHWYAYVVHGLRKIRGVPPGSGTYALLGTINLSTFHAGEATIVLAGAILHETCHSQRILAGLLRYDTEEQRFIEENICETVRTGALEEIDPSRPPNVILQQVIADFFSQGRHFDFNAAAQVERERGLHLLSQNN